MNWIIRWLRGLLGIKVFDFDAAVMHAEGRKIRIEQLLENIKTLGGNPGPAEISPEMVEMIINCSAKDTLAALRLAGIEITVADDIETKNAEIDTDETETNTANVKISKSEEDAIKALEEAIKRLQETRAIEKAERDKQTAENNQHLEDLKKRREYINSFREYTD